MIRGELRAVLVATVLAAVVGGAWLATSPDPAPAAGAPDPTPASTGAGGQPEALESLRAPDDLQAAKKVAASFATALLRDDLDTLRRLATDELAGRLLTGRTHDPGPGDAARDVVVEGIVTEDLRPARALFQVAVRRAGNGGGQLQTVTVSVVRGDDGWRVADTAF